MILEDTSLSCLERLGLMLVLGWVDMGVEELVGVVVLVGVWELVEVLEVLELEGCMMGVDSMILIRCRLDMFSLDRITPIICSSVLHLERLEARIV